MNSKFPYKIGLLVLLSALGTASADEMGIGHDHDIPGSQPTDPAETETVENLWQELLEWFDVDVEE